MKRIVSAGVALALLGGLASCSDSERPDEARSSAFDPFATLGSSAPADGSDSQVPLAVLAIGDCFDADNFVPGAPIDRRGIRLIACDQPHQHEVYSIELDPDPRGAAFPGDDAMRALADDRCVKSFEPSMGVGYVESNLDYAAITPDAETWAADDRSIVCTVHNTDFAELTGSVRVTTTTSAPAEGG